jgi:DNA-binding IclR family transcriptional regulator
MLAELDPEEVRQFAAEHGLAAMTPKTITDVDKLLRHLQRVKRQGFALNAEESYLGIGSVGAAVRDITGTAVAAVSLSYAMSLVGSSDLPGLIERTVSAAADISSRLERVVIPRRASTGAYPTEVAPA